MVYQSTEQVLSSKLSLSFRNNLYEIAVEKTKSSHHDPAGLADLFKQYGDHLYCKSDFTGALKQYIKTIGHLEPSYIIMRFLDARHIKHLTDYLQALHKNGKASVDHTSLLLNCFTRLNETDELMNFLYNDLNLVSDLLFDLDAPIKLCRNVSFEHALLLAKQHSKHDLCISILTEDKCAYDEALDYIVELDFEIAIRNVKKFGIILMKNCPQRTTDLLKKLCTDCYVSQKTENNFENYFFDSPPAIARATPDDFIYLFTEASSKFLIDFLEHSLASTNSCSQLVYNTLIEQYLQSWKNDSKSENRLHEILREMPTNDESSVPYDRNHILILCSTYDFWPGILYIYDEQQLYHLIIRHYFKIDDYNSLVNTCKRLGKTHPSLWLQALTGLRDNNSAPPNLLSQILKAITQEKLQSPLQVLGCLTVENGPNLSAARDYLLKVFQKDNELSKNEEESIEKYRKDGDKLREHIKTLNECPVEFRGTFCDTCNQSLTIPTAYYLCRHSYHQECLRIYSENDSDKDCPVCRVKNVQFIEATLAQNESRNQHETFHNRINRATEPFSIVAEYFRHAMFNKTILHDETNPIVPEIVPKQIESISNDNSCPRANSRYRSDNSKSNIDCYAAAFSGGTREHEQFRIGMSEAMSQLHDQNQSVKDNRIQNSADQTTKSILKNPFNEEGDTHDESMNPEAVIEINKKEIQTNNPFDCNLNPF